MPRRCIPACLTLAAAALVGAACTVKDTTEVTTSEPPASFSVLPSALSLKVGDTGSVNITTVPALSAGHATVAWTSTQPSVAKIVDVAPLGSRVTVQAVSPGTGALSLTFTAGVQVVTGSVFFIVTTKP